MIHFLKNVVIAGGLLQITYLRGRRVESGRTHCQFDPP
jgi:hypothetical protein